MADETTTNEPETPTTPTPAQDAAAATPAPAPADKPLPANEPAAAQPEAAASQPEPAAAQPPAGEQEQERRKKTNFGQSPKPGKKLKQHMRGVRDQLREAGVMPLTDALNKLKEIKSARSKLRKGKAGFDETVELHMSLGIDPTHSDQMVRGSVSLPNGIGKSVRVLVFCQGDNEAKAKEAGADFAGADEIIQKIQKENWLEFDVALTTQDMMPKVARLGKLLGPRGLMPSPKAGTVIPATGDVAQAVSEFKAGKVEFRNDKFGNIHSGVGKLSFETDKLVENIKTFVDQIKAAKPAASKGNYVLSVFVSATMSPGIQVAV